MAKRGRPAVITPKTVIECYEHLVKKNKEENEERKKTGLHPIHEEEPSKNEVYKAVGGNKATVCRYLEEYFQDKTKKKINILNKVKLPEKVIEVLADTKLEEIEIYKQENQRLKKAVDEYLSEFQTCEESVNKLNEEIKSIKADFENEKEAMNRQLVVAESRVNDVQEREQKMDTQYQKLLEQVNQYKQEAAVAKKEVEMLREQQQK